MALASAAMLGLTSTTVQADNTYHNIHVAWNKIDSAQSYRVAYRQKGTRVLRSY